MVRCFVLGYQDEAIDRESTPPRLLLTARYYIYDDANGGSGEVGQAPTIALALTDSPAQLQSKIEAGVFAHARDVLQFPMGALVASDIRLPAIA